MKLHCTSAKATLIAVVVVAVVLANAVSALAVTSTWDGGATGAGTAWGSVAANWVGDALPASGNDLLFDSRTLGGDIVTPMTVSAAMTVGKITFDTNLPSALVINTNASGSTGRILTINGSGGTLIEKTVNDTGSVAFNASTNGTLSIVLGGSGNINAANASDTINLAPVISQTGGTRSITKIGNGTLILSGANSFSGGLTVSGGIVRLNDNAGAGTGTLTLNGGALRNGGGRTIANPIKLEASTVNAIYAIGTGNVFVFTGALSGSGTLDNTLAVPAETDIAGSTQQIRMQGSLSNFEGTIKINRVTNADQFHFYAVNAGADDGSKAKFVLDGATGPVAADLPAIAIGRNNNTTFKMGALSGNGGRIEDGLSTLGTQMTLEVGHLGTSTQWDGVLANQTGMTVNFTKVGGGTLTLGGNNAYNGATTVNAGTLRVNGSHTGGGAYTVASGATLGGTGSTQSNVVVDPGGTLSPGSSVESLGTGSVTFNAGSTFKFEINSTLVTADLLNASLGNLTLDTTGVGVSLALSDLAVAPLADGTKFTLISYNGTLNAGGMFAGKPEMSVVLFGAQQFRIRYNDLNAGGNFQNETSLTGHFVTLTAVPEASSILVFGLGGIFAIGTVWLGKRCGLAAFRIS